MSIKVLSKSDYLLGLICPKSLWIKINSPELLPEINKSIQRRFDEGHIIGNLAKKCFPKGVEIKSFGYDKISEETQEKLKQRVPLFEGGFLSNNCFTRVDILIPIDEDEWEVIEVKGSTSIKKEHLEDVAFQKYAYESAGLKIKKYNLMYLNNEYVKNGELDLNELFIIEDITSLVEEYFEGIEDRINYVSDLINSDEYDESTYGKHCNSPKTCPLPDLDWGELPEHNIFELYYGGKKSKELFSQGIIEIKDVPSSIKLSDKQKIQCDCIKCNDIYISHTNIKNFINNLEYPLFHLDFETFQSGVPLYDGSKSYQQIPFQFSLHIEKENGEIEHYEFLADSQEDPRINFIKTLKEKIDDNGSIIVYNKSFEKTVMKNLGEFMPEYQEWVKEIEPRYVDLLDVFRNFWYYNPEQRGSCSIKKVLPSLIPEKNYQDLEITNGGDASLEYFYSIFKYSDEGQIKSIRNSLLEYCKMDTEAMVDILNHLKKLS